MLLVPCPYCEETLPEVEFAYAGEAHVVRPHPRVTDEAWRDFLYIRTNTKGPHRERWRHVHGCGRYFNAVRDTVSDRILTTYAAGASTPEIGDGA